ncbi:MAG: class I SAM-dependent methyltransferase [Candidatus Aminicenantales bacterium]
MYSLNNKNSNASRDPDRSLTFPSAAPFQRAEVEDYERRRYRGIDQKIVHWREARILGKVLKVIQREDGASGRGTLSKSRLFVLDLPSGYGRFSSVFQKEGMRLVSSDLSFDMVKRTREKTEDVPESFGVVADAKQGLPFKNGIFERIFSIRFFHHLHEVWEREAVIKEFCRISSGWVVLSFYRMNALHFLQRKFRRLIKKSKTQIKMISLRQFHGEAENAGFRVRKTFPLIRGIHAYQVVLLKKDEILRPTNSEQALLC